MGGRGALAWAVPRRLALPERTQPSSPASGSAAGVLAAGIGTVVAVVVTHDRPQLLRRCLQAIVAQQRPPELILVVDNPGAVTGVAEVVAGFPQVRHLRLPVNVGGAGGYRIGIDRALAEGAGAVWLMDDDGHPADAQCLQRLVATAEQGCGLVAPLVLDIADSHRLAFPIRQRGRRHQLRCEAEAVPRIDGFAHLFNGALVRRETFARIGLPDARYVIRGDEVEFLQRALRAGIRVCIDTGCHFLHPSSRGEIEPILFGLFYAVEPGSRAKRYYQFRNRGRIFLAYGLWHLLLADILRYGCLYLVNRRDPRGFLRWLAATAAGWRGAFLQQPWQETDAMPMPPAWWERP